MLRKPGASALEKGGDSFLALVTKDLGVSTPTVVVDADVQEVVTDATWLVAAIAGDPVTGTHDARQFLDVDVQQLAGRVALVAMDRRLRVQIAQATEAVSS